MTYYDKLYKIIRIGCDKMKLKKSTIICRVIFTILVVLVIGFIFSQSLLPATESSAESGRVIKFLNGILESINIPPFITQHLARKAAHFIEFGVLGFCLCAMINSYTAKTVISGLSALGGTALVAMIDESLQLISDGRSFQVSDILLDTLGGFTFIFILTVVIFIARKKKEVKNNE